MIEYDRERIGYKSLARAAKAEECASIAFPTRDDQVPSAKAAFGSAVKRSDGSFRPVEDTKYYLKRTSLKHVPMSELQAVRLNSLENPWRDYAQSNILAPIQLAWLAKVVANPKHDWPVVCELGLRTGSEKYRGAVARLSSED